MYELGIRFCQWEITGKFKIKTVEMHVAFKKYEREGT
jgi:hypothetical protein